MTISSTLRFRKILKRLRGGGDDLRKAATPAVKALITKNKPLLEQLSFGVVNIFRSRSPARVRKIAVKNPAVKVLFGRAILPTETQVKKSGALKFLNPLRSFDDWLLDEHTGHISYPGRNRGEPYTFRFEGDYSRHQDRRITVITPGGKLKTVRVSGRRFVALSQAVMAAGAKGQIYPDILESFANVRLVDDEGRRVLIETDPAKLAKYLEAMTPSERADYETLGSP